MKTFKLQQLQLFCKIENVIHLCETYYKDKNNKWYFGCFYNIWNDENLNFIVKRCKDRAADPLDLWLIAIDNENNPVTKYRISANNLYSFYYLIKK